MSWLILRGLSREKRHWGGFAESFEAKLGGRVVALDLPGFGTENARRSPATVRGIVEDVRDRLRNERSKDEAARWSILGISLGGMVALEWCAQHPDDFERCVAINSSARPSPTFQRFHPRALLSPFARGAVAKERAVLGLTSDRSAAYLDELAVKQAKFAELSPPDRASVPRQLFAASRFSTPRSVRAKLLVLASRTDRLVSYRCSERIAKTLGADFLLSESGGHDLALDEPEWIAEQVAGWML
jgi:pimeloyl-ACP methyl ester carboxylesterase